MKIDLSLKNKELYAGCEIEEVAGRLNLVTPITDAINIVGRNIDKIISPVRGYAIAYAAEDKKPTVGWVPPEVAVSLGGNEINVVADRAAIEAAEGFVPKSVFDSVILTGPMAVWAYLVVFHAVVHQFNCVYYDDGRNGPVLIAAHGYFRPPQDA